MSSQSEQSFGARLRKFQDAIQFIKTWPTYDPPRVNETVMELDNLAMAITALNDKETERQSAYTAAVQERQQLFNRKEGSFDKILVNIRGAVEAQYGKDHNIAKQVKSIIAMSRDSKLIKLPANPANPDNHDAVSRSQKSYGSRIKYLADIITILKGEGSYKSSNPALSIDGLTERLNRMNATSDSVASLISQMAGSRRERTAKYEEMEERRRRIKAYVKSQYGISSAEYLALRSINF